MGFVETEVSLFYLLNQQSTDEFQFGSDHTGDSENIIYELENGWNIYCSEIDDTSISVDSATLEGVYVFSIGPIQSSSLLHIRFSFDEPESSPSLENSESLITACNESEEIVEGQSLADSTNTGPIVMFSSSFYIDNGSITSNRLGQENLPTILSQIADDEQGIGLRQIRQASVLSPDSQQLTVIEFPSLRTTGALTGTAIYCRTNLDRCHEVFDSIINKHILWAAIVSLYDERLTYWSSSVGHYRSELQNVSTNYLFTQPTKVPTRDEVRNAISSKSDFYGDYRNIRDDCYMADELGDCLLNDVCKIELNDEREDLSIQPMSGFSDRATSIREDASLVENEFQKLKEEYDLFAEQLAQDSNLLLSIESRDLQRSVRALTVATVLIGGTNLFAAELANGVKIVLDRVEAGSLPINSISWLLTNPHRDVGMLLLYVFSAAILIVFIYRSRIKQTLSQFSIY